MSKISSTRWSCEAIILWLTFVSINSREIIYNSENKTFSLLHFDNDTQDTTLEFLSNRTISENGTAQEIAPSPIIFSYHSVNSSAVTDETNSTYANFTVVEILPKSNETESSCRGLSLTCGRKCCMGEKLLDWEKGYCENTSSYKTIDWKMMSWTEGNNANAALYDFAVKEPPDKINNKQCLTVNVSENTENDDEGNRIKYFLFMIDSYCTDNTHDSTGNFDMAFACFEPITLSYFHFQAKCLYPLKVIGSISTSLLLILSLMFLMYPKRNLQVKCMAAFCFAVFARDLPNISIIPVNITRNSIFSSSNVCRAIAVIRQILSLSVSFWTTILCSDKSRVIRKSLKFRFVGESRRRFLYYSLLCWGVPFAIGMITLILMYLPQNLTSVMKPIVHSSFCGLQWWTLPTLILHDGPLLLLLIYNTVVMGSMTVSLIKEKLICICCRKNESSVMLRSNSNNDHVAEFKQRLYIYFLLHALWLLKMILHMYRSNIFIMARVAMRWLQNFRGFILFIIIAKIKNWSLLKDTYNRLSNAARDIGGKVILKICPTAFYTDHSDNIIEQTRF